MFQLLVAITLLSVVFCKSSYATSVDPMYKNFPKVVSFHLGVRTSKDLLLGARRDVQKRLQEYFIGQMENLLDSIDSQLDLRIRSQGKIEDVELEDILYFGINIKICCKKNGLILVGINHNTHRYFTKDYSKKDYTKYNFEYRGGNLFPIIFRINIENSYEEEIYKGAKSIIINNLTELLKLSKKQISSN